MLKPPTTRYIYSNIFRLFCQFALISVLLLCSVAFSSAVANQMSIVGKLCEVRKPYPLIRDTKARRFEYQGTLNKGVTFVPVGGTYSDFYRVWYYDKPSNSFVKSAIPINSSSGKGKSAPTKGAMKCWYSMPENNNLWSTIVENDGFLRVPGEKLFATQRVSVRSPRASMNLNYVHFDAGSNLTAVHKAGNANLIRLKLKSGETIYQWERANKFMTPATWQEKKAAYKESVLVYKSSWARNLSIIVLILFAGVLLLRTYAEPLVLAVTKRDLFVCTAISFLFFLMSLAWFADDRDPSIEQVLADSPSAPLSLILGLPFLFALPFVGVGLITLLRASYASDSARRKVRDAIPDDFSKKARYQDIGDDVKAGKWSYVKRKRTEATTEELRRKAEAYDEIVRTARKREEAKDTYDD